MKVAPCPKELEVCWKACSEHFFHATGLFGAIENDEARKIIMNDIDEMIYLLQQIKEYYDGRR